MAEKFNPNDWEPIKTDMSDWEPIESMPKPSLWERFKSGFMEKSIPQPKGLERGDVAEFAGKAGLETLGGTIGGSIGTLGGPLAPYTVPLGIAAGAAAGKASHEAIRRGIGAFSPGSTEMGSDLGVVGKVAGEAALQGLGAKYIPPAVGLVGVGIKKVGALAGTKVIAPIIRSTSGVGKEAMDLMIESPSKVLEYIGKSPEQIASYGKAFQEAITANVERAGELYDSIIKNQVKNSPLYTDDFKSNLGRVMMDTIQETRKDFGYGLINRMVDPVDAKVFNNLVSNISQKLKHPSAEELYYLQRDMTNVIKKNIGTPLAASVGRLKTRLMDYLAEKIPEIGEANSIYKSAMNLAEELKGVVSAENPTAMIKNALGKFTTKGDKITSALSTLEKGVSEDIATPAVRDIMAKSDAIAGARKALEGVVYGSAAKEFTPIVKDLPRTGFLTGLGYAAATHPVASLAAAPFLSPRAVGYMTAGAVKGTEALGKGLGSEVSKTIGKYSIPMATKLSTEELMRRYNAKK